VSLHAGYAALRCAGLLMLVRAHYTGHSRQHSHMRGLMGGTCTWRHEQRIHVTQARTGSSAAASVCGHKHH
jgi:hypothetical protein